LLRGKWMIFVDIKGIRNCRGNPLWLPKNRAGTLNVPTFITQGLPLQGYDPMNWEIAKCGLRKRLGSSIFRNSPFAISHSFLIFRNPPFAFHNSDARIMIVIILNLCPTSGKPIVGATPCGCPKTGQARGPAPTKDFSIPKSEFRTPNS
jgi:hypothetical protein